MYPVTVDDSSNMDIQLSNGEAIDDIFVQKRAGWSQLLGSKSLMLPDESITKTKIKNAMATHWKQRYQWKVILCWIFLFKFWSTYRPWLFRLYALKVSIKCIC